MTIQLIEKLTIQLIEKLMIASSTTADFFAYDYSRHKIWQKWLPSHRFYDQCPITLGDQTVAAGRNYPFR